MGRSGRALSTTRIYSQAQRPRGSGTASIRSPAGLCPQHSCCGTTPGAGLAPRPWVPWTRGTLAHEQDEAPGLCSCRQFPIKELMRDEGPQRAVILVQQSVPMVCQILTIGAVGWAPAGLVFHRLPPHCPEQQRGDHGKLSLVPFVSFLVINTSQPCVPLSQHTSLLTPTWRQWLEDKGYLNNEI